MTPMTPAIVIPGSSPNAASTDGKSRVRVAVSHAVAADKTPWLATVAPRESPRAAAAAPRLPVPTRDQTDVAQPLPATMPTPNITPPTIEAAGVTSGSERVRTPNAARPLTVSNRKPRAAR